MPAARGHKRLSGSLAAAAKAMSPRERREFMTFLRECDERREDLTVGDARQPFLFPAAKIPRKVDVRQRRLSTSAGQVKPGFLKNI